MELLVALSDSGWFGQISERFLDWFGSLFGPHALTAIAAAKIIGINIILSGDNAVVIALACRSLPARQRMMGILLGAGAAIALRILFTMVVVYLMGVPWLQIAGSLLLFWIAIKLLIADEAEGDGVASGSSLWEAVKIVAIADIVMSLDNVLAIAGAAQSAPVDQRLWLIIFGLAVSIPLVIVGSTLIMGLLARFPVLVWAGAALLGWIAGELMVSDKIALMQFQAWNPALVEPDSHAPIGLKPAAIVHYGAAVAGALVVLLAGWFLVRRRHRNAVGVHEQGPAE
jgi:YjbE family integral membrane protein